MRPTVYIHHEQDAVVYQLQRTCQVLSHSPRVTFVNLAADRVDRADKVYCMDTVGVAREMGACL